MSCFVFENYQIFDWKSGNFLFVNLQVSFVMASVLSTWVNDDNSDNQTETGNAENSKQSDSKESYTKFAEKLIQFNFTPLP